MVAEAKRRAPASVAPLEFRTGDVRKLDFPDSSFDAVRTDRVLIFVPEVEKALTEIFRVLRPGGRLVTSELDGEAHFVDSPMVEVSREVFAVLAQTGMSHSRTRSPTVEADYSDGLQECQINPAGHSPAIPDVSPHFRPASSLID